MTTIVDKLIQLGQTLSNKDITNSKKIKVLKTLDEIDLNINELSSSGIGKAVKSLRNEPNDLGSLSKSLVQKWKKNLEEHLAKENLEVKEAASSKNLPSNVEKVKKKIKVEDSSIDSSSGISFIDSLKVPVAPVKKKSLKRKTLEIPAEKIDVNLEPDYIEHRIKKQKNDEKAEQEIDPEFESGNLKYKSKKILYAPRKPASDTVQNHKVFSLVHYCVQVLSNHINQVDHVGTLPFEIFEKALPNATVTDLARIQKHNPQFIYELQPYWVKQANKDYPLVNFDKMMKENPNTRPSELYKKLKRDTENKLEKFINRTANKVKAEQNAMRTTLTTEAIAPRNSNRRFSSFNSSGNGSRGHSSSASSSSRAHAATPLFIPKNMSHPDGTRGLLARPSTSQSSASKPKQGGDLLAKLRKKFR